MANPMIQSVAVAMSAPCESGNICGQGFISNRKSAPFILTYLRAKMIGKFYFEEGNLHMGNCGISTLDYLSSYYQMANYCSIPKVILRSVLTVIMTW